MAAAAQTAPVRAPGVIARRIAGETILVPSRRRAREMALFTLNEVGTFLWERLDGRRGAATLARDVAETFDVGAEQAERDVRAFLVALAEAGCAEDAAAGAAGEEGP